MGNNIQNEIEIKKIEESDNNSNNVHKPIYKYKNNFNSLIHSDTFIENKIFLELLESKKKLLKFVIPQYKYTECLNNLLIIQTPFLDVGKYISYNTLIKNNKQCFEIYFDFRFFDANILKIFMSYDNIIDG